MGIQESALAPMIGGDLRFAYPWLEDSLSHVDMMRLTRRQLKPVLLEALDCCLLL